MVATVIKAAVMGSCLFMASAFQVRRRALCVQIQKAKDQKKGKRHKKSMEIFLRFYVAL
jgi:hypothetical protein